jgi:2',3'-cyclic-nucleotide 2'-phosphodiesterase (5'-nucleotidase family)
LKAKCLNSNITFKHADDAPPTFPSVVTDTKGFKIGWLGFLLKDTEDMLKISVGESKCPISVEPILDCAQSRVDALYQKNPDLNFVIAVTHQFVAEDRKMAQTISNLHLILGPPC